MRLYVLSVRTGGERAVRRSLERLGVRALVPRRETLIRRKGVWKTEEEVLFPGYVFPELEPCPETYYQATGLPDVRGFLTGGEEAPQALSREEESRIRLLGNQGEAIGISRARMEEGRLKVLSGFLLGREQEILRYDARRKRAVIGAILCGRARELTVSLEWEKT